MHARALYSTIKFSLILLMTILFALPESTAFAQNAITQAVELTKSAMEDYDFIELESADAKIVQAVKLVENAGINDPGAANIYIAEGVIGYGRFKDSDIATANSRAYAAFLKAVMLNPNIVIPKDYKTTELDKILENAKQTVLASQQASQNESNAQQDAPKQEDKAEEKTPAPEVKHFAVASADRCKPLSISAVVPAHPEVAHVYLYYANDNQKVFTPIEMTPDEGDPTSLKASIPEDKVQGEHLRYYIEATNSQQLAVASAGTATQPMSSLLMGACELPDETPSEYGNPYFQISTLVGTGFGYVKGDTLRCKQDSKCNGIAGQNHYDGASAGMSTLPFHVRINAAVNLPANFQLALYFRLQAVNYATEDTLANILFGLSLRYFILHDQPYRLYAGIGIGYGGANAAVFLGENYGNFVDIYKYDGPVHIAPELGFLLTLTKNVGLAFELSVPIYFPNRPSFHFDISVGPFFQF